MNGDEDTILLRPASEDDLELLLAWRSNPEIYQFFENQDGPIPWDEHWTWWQNRTDREDYVIMKDGLGKSRAVGSVNVANLDTDVPEVGIFIGEQTVWGEGIGKQALMLLIQELSTREYEGCSAIIKNDNVASRSLFTSVGFEYECDEGPRKSQYLYCF